MVWDQLSINKPHLVYIILGGFTSIFMLCSLFIKEKLYIGEATVATICGLIFGPHAANLINPLDWGNTDQITLEFSRIVLVVQCFAVGVELPKAYMERHWKSVVLLLVPVMTFGWLITSLFIWWMIVPLTWLESLCCAACVTATDPVLASSVVGKGKFAKRVPKHIRDLLSAESGCNDGMAFPFIYLALNLIHYHLDASHVTMHWFCYTILYECIWGAVYGVLVGYAGRHAIRLAERRGLIDRESFLVFYFVLALFCAGSGSMLGMDDLLVGFAAGVGFSNDGWFTAKTEESHVSNVIDLLLNLTYFVYLGTIIPWDQFNSPIHGLEPWRLTVIAIFVIFFRRIPIMLILKPVIPDIKTWREALFCGHFGPIGVGAIFVAILARAELESNSTTPLAELPDPSVAEYVLIYTIWPITTFLVISSIIVHGSSIAVFTLGRRINTLTMTISFTQGNEQSARWMDRLPRLQSSQSRSFSRGDSSDLEDEKLNLPPGQLPPIGIPQFALRRQKDEDYNKPFAGATGRVRPRAKRRSKKKYENVGGPISASAIEPARRSDPTLLSTQESNSDTLREKSEQTSLDTETLERLRSDDTDSESERRRKRASEVEAGQLDRKETHDGGTPPDVEAYDEGDQIIVEDAEGNVISTTESKGMTDEQKAKFIDKAREKLAKDTSGKYTKYKHESHPGNDSGKVQDDAPKAMEQQEKTFRDTFKGWKGFGKRGEEDPEQPKRARGPAHAYQIGNTIIVEDEDGEVIKKYVIPREKGEGDVNERVREQMRKMSTWVGMGRRSSQAVTTGEASKENLSAMDAAMQEAGAQPTEVKKDPKSRKRPDIESIMAEDDGLRMVISRQDRYGLTGYHKPKPGDRPDLVTMGGGRRMSTKDFLQNVRQMDQTSRIEAIDSSDAPEDIKAAARRGDFRRPSEIQASAKPGITRSSTMPAKSTSQGTEKEDEAADYFSAQATSPQSSNDHFHADIPSPSTTPSRPQPQHKSTAESLDTIGEEDVPTHDVRAAVARHGQGETAAERRRAQASRVSRISEQSEEQEEYDSDEETPAERRRRLAALRSITQDSEDGENEGETAVEKRRRLAALGVGSSGNADSSSDSDGEGPRIPKARRAVQEPEGSPYDTRQQPSQTAQQSAAAAPRTRIQWGGETRGHVRGDEDDGNDAPSNGAGSKLKGFFRSKS